MHRPPLPSERLKARLAQAAVPQAADLDARAARFIGIAEAAFADPLARISAPWRCAWGNYVFSRAAHQFSEYEAFVYKLTVVLGGLGYMDRGRAVVLAAASTHAGGACIVERESAPSDGLAPSGSQLGEEDSRRKAPRPLADYAVEISSLAAAHRGSTSAVLRAWLEKHVGPSPAARDATSNSMFTEVPGPYTLPLGLLPTGATLYYRGNASLLTVAPPGKGKTQCHVLPTLASYRGPVIVLDIKGEYYANTAGWRRDNIGPVYRFNPVEPDTSHRYNPLAFVDDSPDEIWQSAQFLAGLLVVIRSQSDSTWESQGKDLLTLLIAFVTLVHDPAERRMTHVLDLVNTIGLSDMLAMVASPGSPFPATMRRVAARFGKMEQAAPKQFEGVLSGASQHLQVWDGPKVERATAAADWRPEDFRGPLTPTLYLCIPPEALETYAPLLRVIVAQHLRRLMRHHVASAAPILFLLDELPQLGHMEPVRQALELGRSYGIKIWMIAQFADQLVQAYPGVGEGMMDSCDVRMYMNPSARTAERVARAFGKSRDVLGQAGKPVLEVAEITGPAHRDSIFVLADNERQHILRKRLFAHHPV